MKTITIRGISNKTILSMRKRQFKRYTKGKFILPVKDFCFSVYYGTKPVLYARGKWNRVYEDVDLIFRSTDLAIKTRYCDVKALGWHKNIVYSGGEISLYNAPVINPNVYCIFDTKRDMIKFKIRN